MRHLFAENRGPRLNVGDLHLGGDAPLEARDQRRAQANQRAAQEEGADDAPVEQPVLGAVAGGIAGQAIEQGTTRRTGVEITIKLDSGALLAIVQEADEAFKSGERVRILSDGVTSRVTH